MYIGVDIGGTKTLIALLDSAGKILKHQKYPTDERFSDFSKDLVHALREDFMSDEVKGIAIAAPGEIDYESGEGTVFGNLPWHNVPLLKIIKEAFGLPVLVENDANTAAVAEARALDRPANTVVYITISTGIGTGIIVNEKLDESFRRSEAGHMLFERDGKMIAWEKFASGKAIYEKYGKYARELDNDSDWNDIAGNLAIGLINISALLSPDVIILGGSIGNYYSKYSDHLSEHLESMKNELKMVPLPRIVQAKHPEEAVVYGCYELLKDLENG